MIECHVVRAKHGGYKNTTNSMRSIIDSRFKQIFTRKNFSFTKKKGIFYVIEFFFLSYVIFWVENHPRFQHGRQFYGRKYPTNVTTGGKNNKVVKTLRSKLRKTLILKKKWQVLDRQSFQKYVWHLSF